jgi:hypothetical protein
MVVAWWRKLISRNLRSAERSGRRGRRLGARTRGPWVELLEDRTVPSVTFTPGPLAVPALNRADVTPAILAGPAGQPSVSPMVSLSPLDPGRLIVSSQNGERISTNGGGTFTTPTTTFPIAAAAGGTCTVYDAAGQLFWVNVDATDRFSPRIALSQIDPATGSVMGSMRYVSTPPPGHKDDRPFLAAGADGSLYAAWTRFDTFNNPSVQLSRSTNLGQTWSNPVTVSTPTEGFVGLATVAVDPDGYVYVAYHGGPGFSEGTSGSTYVVRYPLDLAGSSSKTLAFSPGASDLATNVQTDFRRIPKTRFWTQGSAQPHILIDRHPQRRGHVYVITADDPGNGSGIGDLANVVLARSTNNGQTWTTSTVEAGPNNSFQLFPMAAIDSSSGTLAVAWYDNRRGLTNAADRYLLDVFAKYSTDGGATWSPSFQVNDLLFDPDAGATARFIGPPVTTRIGEHLGLAVWGGTAYVAWTGNTFSGGVPSGQQVKLDAFPLSGTLLVEGDEGGVVRDDQVRLRGVAGNPGFVEVLVNGSRQYVGLASALTGLTVNGLGGNDTLTVEFVNGNPVPLANGLTFNGGAGTNDGFVLEGGEGGEQFTQTGGQVTVSGVTLRYSGDTESVTVRGNGGTDSLTVNSLTTATRFTFNGGADLGDELILVGDVIGEQFSQTAGQVTVSGGMHPLSYDIASVERVSVFGNGGDDSLTVNSLSTITTFHFDGGDGANDALTLHGGTANDPFQQTTGSITLSGFKPVSYNAGPNNVEHVRVEGNNGADTLTVNAPSTATLFHLNGGDGNDSLVISGGLGNEAFQHQAGAVALPVGPQTAWMTYSADTEQVFLHGNGGDDSLTAHFPAGNPPPTGGVTFNGGDGTDSLVLSGGDAGERFDQSAGQVTGLGSTLRYSADTEYLTFWGNNGDDTLVVHNYSDPVTFQFLAGNGSDHLSIGALDPAGQTITQNTLDVNWGTVTAPVGTRTAAMLYTRADTEHVTVWGNSGNDHFHFHSPSSTTTFRFNGGTGNDRVTLFGTDGPDEFHQNPGQVAFAAATNFDPFTFDGLVEEIIGFGGLGNDTFWINSPTAATTFGLDGGAGHDVLYLYTTGNDETLSVSGTLTTITGLAPVATSPDVEHIRVHGQGGNDTFHVTPSIVATFFIDGGGGIGTDVLHLTFFPPGSSRTNTGGGAGFITFDPPFQRIDFVGIEI